MKIVTVEDSGSGGRGGWSGAHAHGSTRACPFRSWRVEAFAAEGGLQWPHPTGVCAKIANGGRLIQGPISRTPRWASAPKKHSSHSAYASRGLAAVITIRLASRPGPRGQVRPLRLRSRNAEAVNRRHMVGKASGREPPRGDLAMKDHLVDGSIHAAGWCAGSADGSVSA